MDHSPAQGMRHRVHIRHQSLKMFRRTLTVSTCSSSTVASPGSSGSMAELDEVVRSLRAESFTRQWHHETCNLQLYHSFNICNSEACVRHILFGEVHSAAVPTAAPALHFISMLPKMHAP